MTTTDLDTHLTSGDGTQAVIDTAIAAAEPTPLDDQGRFFAQTVPSGASSIVIDIEEKLERFAPTPRRKAGTYTVHDVPSFEKYFARHGDDESEVWADITRLALVAVLNSHTIEGPQWEDHTLRYAVQQTDAWKAWATLDGKMVDQVTFAEHIEARSIDMVTPSGTDMLEIAQTFQATTGVEFQSSELLASGERKLTYREETTAKAGQLGTMHVPTVLTLGLVPFEGAARYEVTARFRYRTAGGKLLLGFFLDRPSDVLREAFQDVVDSVETAIAHPVLRGSGGAPR